MYWEYVMAAYLTTIAVFCVLIGVTYCQYRRAAYHLKQIQLEINIRQPYQKQEKKEETL